MWRDRLARLCSIDRPARRPGGRPARVPHASRSRSSSAIAPGGGADVAARLIAAYAAQEVGAAGERGQHARAPPASPARCAPCKARPDGYTLLLEPHATASMLFAVESDVPFKMDDKTPIALVTLDPVIYTVKADSPWKSLADVAAGGQGQSQGLPVRDRRRVGGGGVLGLAVSLRRRCARWPRPTRSCSPAAPPRSLRWQVATWTSPGSSGASRRG